MKHSIYCFISQLGSIKKYVVVLANCLHLVRRIDKMGYEIERFVCAIDEEFHCSICTMVLKDPLQSPCEHIFCSECINGWLKVKETCPVDQSILPFDDLKPPPRYFRNLLEKMEIRCDLGSVQSIRIFDLDK